MVKYWKLESFECEVVKEGSKSGHVWAKKRW